MKSKKILILLLALIMVFSFAACGGEDAPVDDQSTQGNEENAPDDESDGNGGADIALSRTAKYFNALGVTVDKGLYMEMEAEFDGMTMYMISMQKGDKFYSESIFDAGEQTAISLCDGENIYTLDPATKTAFAMPMDSGEMGSVIDEEFDDFLTSTDYTTGDMDIEGKSYYYEQFNQDDTGTRYCFDGDDLIYIYSEFDGQASAVKIVKISNSIDESKFELPGDYEVFAY